MSIRWPRPWCIDRMKNAALLFALLFAAPAWAANVVVSGAFARASTPGAETGAVYFSLQSDTDDALTGVSTNVAQSAMLHQTTMQGMVMSMDMMDRIDLPAGQKITLAPGGMHIMLQGLTQPLIKGHTIGLHLIFAHAAPQDIIVPVDGIAAMVPGE